MSIISERKREMIRNWARHGYSVPEIARPLRLSPQVVEDIVNGVDTAAPAHTQVAQMDCMPVFIEPHARGGGNA